MGKLHFRAWLAEDNKMVKLSSIGLEMDTVSYYDGPGSYCHHSSTYTVIMQGFEVNNEIIYENDIVYNDNRFSEKVR